MSVVDRVRDMFTRGDSDESIGAELASSPGPGIPEETPVEILVHDPPEGSDTCRVELDRNVSPDGTHLFETYAEAEGWPLVQSLMRVPGIHSVLVKENVLLLSKHAGADWESILELAKEAIQRSHAPRSIDEGAPGTSPVDSIAAATRTSGPEEELRNKVQTILDDEINPAVAAHGGYITLLDVQGTRVFVQLGGGCQGCAMSTATLKHGVESTLKTQIPEISEILDTTDHAAGNNPFYQSQDF